jgi:SpoVK/Ycf46/Vps4 family AAA+-type ATPase
MCKIDELAAATTGLAGSDIGAICRRASMLAIREFVSGGASGSTYPDLGSFNVAARHFMQAIQEVGGRAR